MKALDMSALKSCPVVVVHEGRTFSTQISTLLVGVPVIIC